MFRQWDQTFGLAKACTQIKATNPEPQTSGSAKVSKMLDFSLETTYSTYWWLADSPWHAKNFYKSTLLLNEFQILHREGM